MMLRWVRNRHGEDGERIVDAGLSPYPESLLMRRLFWRSLQLRYVTRVH